MNGNHKHFQNTANWQNETQGLLLLRILSKPRMVFQKSFSKNGKSQSQILIPGPFALPSSTTRQRCRPIGGLIIQIAYRIYVTLRNPLEKNTINQISGRVYAV